MNGDDFLRYRTPRSPAATAPAEEQPPTARATPAGLRPHTVALAATCGLLAMALVVFVASRPAPAHSAKPVGLAVILTPVPTPVATPQPSPTIAPTIPPAGPPPPATCSAWLWGQLNGLNFQVCADQPIPAALAPYLLGAGTPTPRATP
ncbi:MAG TPA: hypothetical protein VKQ30_25895 [Ktedonobacterales bacterium]|nr:hypothetical protein [Ktedonobacterales bacterium]